ncbi:MAG: TonB-dependent receptor [Proteobacteria bacterium]|nr:TonB-dependent receptor [Pseudomonadota bacterium]
MNAAADLGIDVTVTLASPIAEQYLAKRIPALEGINAFTRRRIRNVLAEEIAAGAPLGRQIRRMRREFRIFRRGVKGPRGPSRARTTARTENGIAWGTGQHAQMRESGVIGEIWITSRDARVRQSHAALEGACALIDELFANGLHVASAAYERGDPGLGLERSHGLDLGLKWESAESHLHVNVYQTRFSNYIALQATGASLPGDNGASAPVYAFTAVPARLRGVEVEGRWQLHRAVAALGQFDAVRGDNQSTGEPLPRLAPRRAMLGLEARHGEWSGRLEWRVAARQDRVARFDTPTPGYGTLRLSVARQLRWGQTDALWYLKLDNLGDKLAYNATAVPTIRALAPQAGRSVSTGLQLRF